MARVNEVDITSQIKSPLVRIVESAVAEREPVRPRRILNLAIGLLLGLLSGAGLVLLLESYRRTIRTPEEVDRHLQLPVLGLIPKESVQ
jgi:capsular polysaccharide biosynthesis protein